MVDKPAIQYVVDEALAAGLDHICLITNPGKEAMERHFAPDPELEEALASKGQARLDAVLAIAAKGEIAFLNQGEPRGLGHAVGVAEQWVAGEPFAVLLGDDFLDADDYLLDAMCRIQERTGGSVILLMEVTAEMIQMYGSVDPVAVAAADLPGEGDVPEDLEIHRILRLNEKPAPGEEYSQLAVIGRYVFNPAVLQVLKLTPPGRGGEIQLTDAISTLAAMPAEQGGGVYGVVFRGARYDTGDKLEYLKAVVQLAAKRTDLGPDFTAWLQGFVASRDNE